MYQVNVGVPGALFNVTATNLVAGATSGTSAASVSASQAAVATGQARITHFSGSIDAMTGTATIESPAGTVIWSRYLPSNGSFSQDFDPPLQVLTKNQAVLFKIGNMDATNRACVNGAGFHVGSG